MNESSVPVPVPVSAPVPAPVSVPVSTPLPMQAPVPEHGGTDAGPPVLCDFSTNAHPLGPPPLVLDAVLSADRQRYPDPAYTALREHLAQWHGVTPERVLPAAGGSEAIRRLSLAALLDGIRTVCVPQPGFGDYAAAAQALGLTVQGWPDIATLLRLMDSAGPCLVWICDPCNPTGRTLDAADWAALQDAQRRTGSRLVVDQAYEALRLVGASALPPSWHDQVWRLVCPNKALGLTGVRAAYLLAPRHDTLTPRVAALAASWVLSAEGEALLKAWADDEVQEELADSHDLLREWVQAQQDRLTSWGFQPMPGSVTNFWMARLPALDAHDDLDPDLDLDLDLGTTRRKLVSSAMTGQSQSSQPQTHPLTAPQTHALQTPGPNPLPGMPPEPAPAPLHLSQHVPPASHAALLAALRHHGIKLRDATSFGYPGWVRVSVQTPAAVMTLVSALHQVLGPHHARASIAPKDSL